MSGHSKWATIKRQKGATDAKRGQLFTKLSNAITIAVRQGGGVSDPNSNFKLRLTMDKARAANMPKENIQRAIDRAKGVGSANVEELVYEGFAPGGVAVIVETVTDNKMRTVAEIKNLFDKSGGALGSQGSVAYMFKRRGVIAVPKEGRDSDTLLNFAINAGIEDMEEEGNTVFYYVEPAQLAEAKRGLEEQGLVIESAELSYLPITPTDGADEEKVFALIEKLEDLDDVQQVYTTLA